MKLEQHVALLRGLNVGGAKRVAMADLRKLMTDLGYRDVRTVLNSGNAVFRGATETVGPVDPASRIEEALVLKLGVAARVTVLGAAQFAEVVKENSLLGVASDPAKMLVGVFNDPADRARLEPLVNRDWSPEAFALGQRAAYIWCADGILASRAAAAMGKLLGDAVTTRNWSTMSKLDALVKDQPASI